MAPQRHPPRLTWQNESCSNRVGVRMVYHLLETELVELLHHDMALIAAQGLSTQELS
jgi:hypothetical protein